MSTNIFQYVTYIATTPEKLWEALTSSDWTEKYFFGTKVQSDWQEGAKIEYSRNAEVTDYGIILKCERNTLLSFTWNMVGDKATREQPSRVTFYIKELDEGTVKLSIKHENLLPIDLGDENGQFQGISNGWPAILSNMKSLLETGKTLSAISI